MNFVTVFSIFASTNILLFNLTEEAGSTGNTEIEEIANKETKGRGTANETGTSEITNKWKIEITEEERPHTNTEIEEDKEEGCSNSIEGQLKEAWYKINVEVNADCEPKDFYKNWTVEKEKYNYLCEKFRHYKVKYNKNIILE